MAAPHVTGTVALMFEAAGRPLRIEETRSLLLGSVDTEGLDPSSLNRIGSGFLNIEAAVNATRDYVAVARPVAPRSAQISRSPRNDRLARALPHRARESTGVSLMSVSTESEIPMETSHELRAREQLSEAAHRPCRCGCNGAAAARESVDTAVATFVPTIDATIDEAAITTSTDAAWEDLDEDLPSGSLDLVEVSIENGETRQRRRPPRHGGQRLGRGGGR